MRENEVTRFEIRQRRANLITQLVHGDDLDLGVQERITQDDAADTTWLFSDTNDGDGWVT